MTQISVWKTLSKKSHHNCSYPGLAEQAVQRTIIEERSRFRDLDHRV
jgi:hypothetical protein